MLTHQNSTWLVGILSPYQRWLISTSALQINRNKLNQSLVPWALRVDIVQIRKKGPINRMSPARKILAKSAVLLLLTIRARQRVIKEWRSRVRKT
jgi:hypothetical protein